MGRFLTTLCVARILLGRGSRRILVGVRILRKPVGLPQAYDLDVAKSLDFFHKILLFPFSY